MERRLTGSAELDVILGGGLLPGSLVVIGGAPGTGKTILGHQLCFASATTKHPAIYYTTLSEPHTKLIRHLSSFGFFDAAKLGTAVRMQNLTGLIDGSLRQVTDEIARNAFEAKPSVIVIDSAKALHQAVPGETFRQVVYDLASRVAHTEAVLVLIGEYTPDDVARAPEFAVADTIVTLSNEGFGGVLDGRTLHVVKMRGSDYLSGAHAFRLNSAGFQIFPRIESMLPPSAIPGTGRLSSGVAGLDQMMSGGAPASSVTLVAGPSGSGKTAVAISFLAEGIAKGERCVFVALEESTEQVVLKARGFGWDLRPALDSGLLQIVERQPVELGLDEIGAAVIAAASDGPARRVVIDSMAELEQAAHGSSRFGGYLWTLLGRLRGVGATTFVTSETAAFFGPAFELARGLSFVVDNVILLRYTELESDIRRAMAIVKMRDSDHNKSLVEFEIGASGVTVKSKFAGLSGVLSGNPARAEARFKEFFDK
jgi:circadian clock protein KaiC